MGVQNFAGGATFSGSTNFSRGWGAHPPVDSAVIVCYVHITRHKRHDTHYLYWHVQTPVICLK